MRLLLLQHITMLLCIQLHSSTQHVVKRSKTSNAMRANLYTALTQTASYFILQKNFKLQWMISVVFYYWFMSLHLTFYSDSIAEYNIIYFSSCLSFFNAYFNLSVGIMLFMVFSFAVSPVSSSRVWLGTYLG